MKSILISISLLFCLPTLCQTYIFPGSEVAGTWDKKGSPYIIEGEAIVPEGKQLIIKPGTVIKFNTCEMHDMEDSDFSCGFLRVNGTLRAEGKKKDLITFTRDGYSGFWGVIYIASRDADNILDYCRVEYSYFIKHIISSDNATGGITFNGATGRVTNCLIVNNGWCGINCKNSSSPLIDHCVIMNNNYGIECNSKSRAIVKNSIIWQNENSFYINGKGSVRLTSSLFQDIEIPEYVMDDGSNLKGEDPLLIEDWKPVKGSPCIKAGNDGKNLGVIF